MPETPSTTQESAVRVSISEASRLFGISQRTIRRAIQTQKLRYIVVQNRYKILFASLVTWSQSKDVLRQRRDQQGIGQWVDQWKIKNVRYSPRPPVSVESNEANETNKK